MIHWNTGCQFHFPISLLKDLRILYLLPTPPQRAMLSAKSHLPLFLRQYPEMQGQRTQTPLLFLPLQRGCATSPNPAQSCWLLRFLLTATILRPSVRACGTHAPPHYPILPPMYLSQSELSVSFVQLIIVCLPSRVSAPRGQAPCCLSLCLLPSPCKILLKHFTW